MTVCVALVRGINVGRAKRLAMADLRGLAEGLGLSGVRTVLNSGNLLFETERPDTGGLARALERGIERESGFFAGVVVLTAQELAAVVEENPLGKVAVDPARYLVAFAATPAALAGARSLAESPWAPEAFALGRRAAYLWCPQGVLASPLLEAFTRRTGQAATARNWSTVLKVHAAAAGPSRGAVRK